MSLPSAVKNTEKRVEQLIEQQKQLGNTELSDPAQAASPKGAIPEPQPEPAPATPPSTGPEYTQLEQAYRVLQGKYSAEVPRMAEESRALREQVAALTKHVEDLKEHQAAQATPEVNNDLEGYDDELRNYLFSMQSRLDKAEARNSVLEERLQQQGGNIDTVSQVASQSAQLGFEQQLDALVPDWRNINANQHWLQWLGQLNPLTGTTYQKLLDDASSARDANRVAQIFSEWQRTQNSGQQPANTPPITPGQASIPSPTSVPVEPAQKWTPAAIKAFYTEVSKPHSKYSQEEADRISREIYMATHGPG